MTYEEVKSVMQDRECCRECVHELQNSKEFKHHCDECDKAFEMMYEALEKQIPKKAVNKSKIGVSSSGCIYKGECPRCGLEVRQRWDQHTFCNGCGQLVDFSDSTEKDGEE